MAYQAVFKRYELKYLLTEIQKQAVLEAMKPRMEPDQYGCTTIRSLYFDTDNYRLIRRSLEKPLYKEKLRLRSYAKAGPEASVFVELKKKFDSVVYKRRISLPQATAMDWLCHGTPCGMDSQIVREIDYFAKLYRPLAPTMLLSCERLACYAPDDPGFRVTFDTHILCRRDRLSLAEEPGGTPLLPEGMTLMEIKSMGSMPLWMAHTLNENHIYKTTFSKYGLAYQTLVLPNLLQEANTHGSIV